MAHGICRAPFLLLFFGSALITLCYLIHLLGRKSRLGHVILFALREAIILRLRIADADYITYLVPIIIGVKTIERYRLLRVIKFAAAPREPEALVVMHECSLAHSVKTFRVNEHIDINVCLHRITALGDLTSYAFALPIIPIGNVRVFGLSLNSFHISVLIEDPLLAAFKAFECYSLSKHLSLGITVRALVKQTVECFSSEGLVDLYLILLLMLEVIK